MTSTLVRESRLPVGSSARMSLGLVDERARDGDALLLAARELARVMVERAPSPTRSSAPCARAHRARVVPTPGVDERQLDVLERAGAREQVEALEHEAEVRLRTSASSSRLRRDTSRPASR